jgi:hypothetical protein
MRSVRAAVRSVRAAGLTCGLPALVLASCFSEPAYEPEFRVTYEAVGTGGVAAAPGFELRFADGPGFHFPDSLKIDGVEIMGRDPGRTCREEDDTGILISPTARISASGAAERVNNVLDPVLRGPAVVQAKLDWSTRFPCNANRNPGGTSTFTVFPDGRIMRFDQIVDTSAVMLEAPSQCSCDPTGDSFTISTFWTFARASFNRFHRSDNPGANPLPADGDQIGNVPVACLEMAGQYQVALGWSQNVGAAIRGGNMLVAFAFEFLFAQPRLGSFMYENSSVLVLGRMANNSDCQKVMARAIPSIEPDPMLMTPIKIGGIDTRASLRDGIYGGDSGTVEPGIELQSDSVEVSGALDTSFAVWVRFRSATDAVRAKRTGATGAWYLPQRVDDRSWIIWFKDPLQTSAPITIERR